MWLCGDAGDRIEEAQAYDGLGDVLFARGKPAGAVDRDR